MHHGKYEARAKAAPKRIRRRKLNKYFLVTISLVLLLGIAGGATLAYLSAEKKTVTNTFTPGFADCTVGTDYKVTNTGNVKAYIRAAVVPNWEDTQNNIVYVSDSDPDNKVTINTADWTLSGGYYYYKESITPGAATSAIVSSATNDSNYKLRIDIVAEAIQADGMNASSAEQAWAIATGN